MNHQSKVSLLLFLLSVCTTAALLRWGSSGREAEASLPPAELFAVVQTQLTDFRSEDLSSAYSHASRSFQQNWSLEQFVSMASEGDYRRILRAERVEYGPWHREGNKASLQVFFIHPDGTVLPSIYNLVREGKRWKIDQAQWLRGWPTGQRMRGVRS